MNMAGTLVLGGKQIAQRLPLFPYASSVSGTLGASRCGLWEIQADCASQVFHLPARDKSVEVYTKSSTLLEPLKSLDSMEGPNYRSKLRDVLSQLDHLDNATILNHNTSTHSSIALIANAGLYLYGVYDTHLDQSHLLWCTDPAVRRALSAAAPLRYLVYRFPVLVEDCLFIQIETICAKWWRWTANERPDLQAFTALERRLFGVTDL